VWHRVLTRHDFHLVLAGTAALGVGGAALVSYFERAADGPIQSFGDGLWFAVVTVTTVGYGDFYPKTAEGRGVAFFLMLLGVALFGILTANIAAYFVHSGSGDAEITAKLDEIIERLDRLEGQPPEPPADVA
jgi:voltage-gated potassium channel